MRMRSSDIRVPGRGRRCRMFRGRSAPTSFVCWSRGGRPSRSSAASDISRSSFSSRFMCSSFRPAHTTRRNPENQDPPDRCILGNVLLGRPMTSSTAQTSAPVVSGARYPTVRNFVGGKFTSSTARSQLEVLNPSDGSLLSHVPLSSTSDLAAAIEAAAAAFPKWSTTPVKERVQIFYRYRSLLEENLNELAGLISEEHGKIESEASAEIIKAIELTEFACSLPQIATGEVLEVSRGIECRMDRYPIGVV